MPVDPIMGSIVGSVIGSVVGSALSPSPPEPVTGFVRLLPETARIGTMLPPEQWQVQIDGQTYPMSPGMQIRNEYNMIILPTMVPAPVKVRFTTDDSGAIHRVWILSDAEARLPENR